MLLLTIKARADFVATSKSNLRFYSSSILLLARPTPEKYLKHPRTNQVVDCCRVGYTVTKQIGGAVQRNLVKRRFREAVRKFHNIDSNNTITNHFINNFDYVIIARKDALKSDFRKVCDDLKFCLNGIKKIREKNNAPKPQ